MELILENEKPVSARPKPDETTSQISILNALIMMPGHTLEYLVDTNDLEHIIKIVEHLSGEYKEERLALFIGSGVSKGCGLPDWSELNTALMEAYLAQAYKEPLVWGMAEIPKAIRKALRKMPLPVMGRYLRGQLGASYFPTLRHILYSQSHRVSSSVKAIAQLHRLGAICTYNYDDLLDKEMSPSRTCVITSPSSSFSQNKLCLYHVHGLIPADSSSQIEGDLIFTEDDYHRVYRDAYHWSNTVQLTLLRQFTSLFVGLSIEDPNLRRLLDVVSSEGTNTQQYAIMRRPVEALVPVLGPLQPAYGALKQVQKQSLESIGVHILWITDFDRDIPLILQAMSSENPGAVIVNDFLEFGTEVPQEDEPCLVIPCNRKRLLRTEYCRDHLIRSRILKIGFPLASKYARPEHLATLSKHERPQE